MNGFSEVYAIVKRAVFYCYKEYVRTGRLPKTFPVTEEEYLLLEVLHDGQNFVGTPLDEIHLLGMRVRCVQQRHTYRPPISFMYESPREADSEKSSLTEWGAHVDSLIRDVQSRTTGE